MTTSNNITNTAGLSEEEIEKALANAIKKKANAENRVKLTPEQRAAKKAQDDLDREARKKEREEAKAKRNEAKGTEAPAHMAKVLKARAALPSLIGSAKEAYDRLVQEFSVLDISTVIAHLSQFVREKQTVNALDVELEIGQTVRILRGSPKFTGQLAQVTKANRVRCYVQPIGASKSEYLYTSDVELVSEMSLNEISSEEPEQVESKVA